MTSPSDPEVLSGPKILLQGDSGSGKTYAIGTLVDWAAAQSPPRECFILFTEPGLETLLGYWRDKGAAVPSNLHWHIVPTAALDLKSLMEAAQNVGKLTYEMLTKITDPSRGQNNPAYKILLALADFPDDRTGKKYGNIGSWGADKIFGIDSLSELANCYEKMVVGNKPVMAQNEYGVAQNNLLNFLRYVTGTGTPFTLVMTAHLQKQVNELTGGVTLMTKAIGKAISDDIPKLFSEVLYCYREGLEWYWDTSASNVVTKTRYLPIKSKIKPDLGFIMNKWLKRGEV
jgi:hypothetical protein